MISFICNPVQHGCRAIRPAALVLCSSHFKLYCPVSVKYRRIRKFIYLFISFYGRTIDSDRILFIMRVCSSEFAHLRVCHVKENFRVNRIYLLQYFIIDNYYTSDRIQFSECLRFWLAFLTDIP
jgi:hypothetical protein